MFSARGKCPLDFDLSKSTTHVNGNFSNSFNLFLRFKPLPQNKSLSFFQKSCLSSLHPVSMRGVRVVTNVGRDCDGRVSGAGRAA
jgi:hypothetical protein